MGRRIVLAFDSYKGSLTAPAVCAAAATGLTRLGAIEAVALPLSDGGEGFADALCIAGGGQRESLSVTGPLFDAVPAELVLLHNGTVAVVESAQACGLGLVPVARRSPLHTTTQGVGELLLAAHARGAREVVVGLGGSSTNDGGLGLLQALGWRFLDAHGQALPPVGDALQRVAQIKPGQTLAGMRIVAACDVCNPLYGPEGAARVFAPQKGADASAVDMLDAGLWHFATVCAAFLGKDYADCPGAGAAGGLGFALLAFLHAEFRPGAELAIEHARLDAHLHGAALCMTGEGQTDAQTAYGKLPAAVAARCSAAGVPCVCLSGALGAGWRTLYDQDLTAIFSISPRPQSLEAALAGSAAAVADTAEAIGRLFVSLLPPL